MEFSRIFPFEPENAAKMAAYMKNQFAFCGVNAPERKKLEKPLLAASKTWSWLQLKAAIDFYYGQPEREYQYFAIDLAEKNLLRLTLEELKTLLPLVTAKKWWDSIDAWRKVFSNWCLAYPNFRQEVFAWFDQQPDFWLRRIAITLQLKFKEQTDPALLTAAILPDLATGEFFIQKAIGWALREYSKTNPVWVENFINEHQLSKLACQEGSKYLP